MTDFDFAPGCVPYDTPLSRPLSSRRITKEAEFGHSKDQMRT
ncbi:hypothetical protein [Paracoccus sp. AK26]|nr:hypothetical protein [Paracoccus sp. AK26]